MGVQCNFLISWHGENKSVEEVEGEIFAYVKNDTGESRILSKGNREWGLYGLNYLTISMKDWYEPECKRFIKYLRTINWEWPDTVQVYYCPASYDIDNLFKYIKLFKKNKKA